MIAVNTLFEAEILNSYEELAYQAVMSENIELVESLCDFIDQECEPIYEGVSKSDVKRYRKNIEKSAKEHEEDIKAQLANPDSKYKKVTEKIQDINKEYEDKKDLSKKILRTAESHAKENKDIDLERDVEIAKSDKPEHYIKSQKARQMAHFLGKREPSEAIQYKPVELTRRLGKYLGSSKLINNRIGSAIGRGFSKAANTTIGKKVAEQSTKLRKALGARIIKSGTKMLKHPEQHSGIQSIKRVNLGRAIMGKLK